MVRREFLKGLKYNSKKSCFEQCHLVDNCVDKHSFLIDAKNNSCKNNDLPIYLKYVELFSWKHNDFYYYFHGCIIGEKMNTDGYPYKFVTIFGSDTYYCFLESEDTVKELITLFLKLNLGKTYSFTEDHNAYIIFHELKLSPDIDVINRFKTQT